MTGVDFGRFLLSVRSAKCYKDVMLEWDHLTAVLSGVIDIDRTWHNSLWPAFTMACYGLQEEGLVHLANYAAGAFDDNNVAQMRYPIFIAGGHLCVGRNHWDVTAQHPFHKFTRRSPRTHLATAPLPLADDAISANEANPADEGYEGLTGERETYGS